MGQKKPLISIIVRTKDRPILLKRALQSITAQTYRPLEVILVNDGGCDLDIQELAGILGNVHLNYQRLEQNRGRSHAGNVGIEHATGTYIGFLDDDDEFYPGHIDTLVSFLTQSDMKIAYTDTLFVFRQYNPDTFEIKETGREPAFSQDFDYDNLLLENYIPFMCLLFEREVLVECRGFDDSLDLYEDWDLLIRAGGKYPFQHIQKVTSAYNQWSTELQIAQRNEDRDFLKRSYLTILAKHKNRLTPEGIHACVSGYAHNRLLLKALHKQSEEKDTHITSLETTIREMASHVTSLEAAIAERDSYTHSLEAVIQQKDVALDDLNDRINALEAALQDKTRLNTVIAQELSDRTAYIQKVHSSRGWKVLEKYYRTRERLLPEGTRRRLFVKLLFKMITAPKEVMANLKRSNIHKFFYYLKNSDPETLGKKIEQKLAPGSPDNAPLAAGRQAAASSPAGRDYFNFLFEMNTRVSSDFVPLSSPALHEKDVRLIAFYLPQFHPIPENDAWWGRGFTEWTNVSRAVPQFIGHHQPRLPGELGFYDLRVPEIQKRQAELARQYGVYGFCFHFYWFNGRTLLEHPIREFAENVDFPFCINWANENWTRRWDGNDSEVLMAQRHSPEDDIAFIEYVSRYMKNSKYIRVNTRPLLMLYRPALLPDPKATAARWRKWCLDNGIGEIYLAATHTCEHIDPRSIGFDAAVEFAPNTFPLKDIASRFTITNPAYKGILLDYQDALQLSLNYQKPPYKKFRGVCPGWDNEARRPGKGTVLVNTSPDSYRLWLQRLLGFTRENFDADERLVFVNAWNEWAEGAYLEPDRRYGYAYLQATAEAFAPRPKESPLPGEWKILFVSHDACKGGAQAVLLSIISWFKRHTFAEVRILCLDGGELLHRFSELGDTLVLSEMTKSGVPTDEVVRKLKESCGGRPDLIYGNSVASGRGYGLLRELNAPIVTHFHELEMSIKRYAADWIGDVLEYSSHFIACSGAVRDNLTVNHGVEGSRISVVYASIEPDISIQIAGEKEKLGSRKRLGLEENRFLVVGCGMGMAFRKGADLFINTARSLRARGVDNFHFYWIGDFDANQSDGRYGVWVEHVKAMKKEGLDRFVTFLGIKENPKEFFQAGDVFLLTSREDPFPLVALEAAECGLPVVCFSDAGGMPDFVADDVGFIVPYEDAEAMAEKVVVLMENEDFRQQMGARAREKMLSRFTVAHTTPHILSACRTAAAKKPAVSVIIPNYNHARYLPKRLESVFNQTFKNFEVILLDDASTDNSMEELNKYSDHADIRIVRNEKNSGSPFIQWLRGLALARADIIWIAESDDMCELRFLETLLPVFRDPEVKLAYANSHVTDESNRVTGDYETGEYLTSLSHTKWKKNYRVYATEEINDGLGVKNTILNMSAVLFRRFDFSEEFRRTLEHMNIAGDWYFIVNAIKNGKVHYEAEKLNYHRKHSESVIGKTVSEKRLEGFFREFLTVQQFVFDTYQLNDHFCKKWESYLRKQWDDFNPGKPFEELHTYYPFDDMRDKIMQKTKDHSG
ncbi:MAG: glycoside hydrolase family 99-like domain-containing protein [Thermodesulfovibrionales bacterium]